MIPNTLSKPSLKSSSFDDSRPFNWTLVWFVGVFVIGVYLYLTHLSGATIGHSDENRVYHFNYLTPLNYMISSPFTRYFKSHDAPFYVLGTLGFLNIFMVYFIAKNYFSKSMAVYAATFYLIFDLPLIYAKQMYYSLTLLTLMMAAISLYVLAEKTKKSLLAILPGMILSLMLWTNASSYALILATGIFIVVSNRMNLLGGKPIALIPLIFFLTLGSLVGYFLVEGYVYLVYRNNPRVNYSMYWEHFLGYELEVKKYFRGLGGIRYLNRFFEESFNYFIVNNWNNTFRNSFIILMIIFSFLVAIVRRSKGYLGFLILSIVGAGIFSSNVLFEKHVIYLRNFVWLSLPISLAFAYSCHFLFQMKSNILRNSFYILISIYAVFAFSQCIQVTRSVPSVNEILRYIEDHNIHKNEIASIYYSVNRMPDYISGKATQSVPLVRTYREEDVAQRIHYMIHWPAMHALYKQGKVKYYLSSSLGHMANIGKNDPVLKLVKPRVSFDCHPFNNPFFFHDRTHLEKERINLYALSDIFGPL